MVIETLAALSTFFVMIEDVRTTYLPENFMKGFIVLSMLYWLFRGRFLSSLAGFLLYFLPSFILYRLGVWASGEVLYFAMIGSALHPIGGFTRYFLFSIAPSALVYSLFLYSLTLLKKSRFIALLPFISFPLAPNIVSYLAFLAIFVILTKKDFEELRKKKIPASKITEDYWLAKDLRIGKRLIKARRAITKEEAELIRKNFEEVEVIEGFPFTPPLFIATLLALWLVHSPKKLI